MAGSLITRINRLGDEQSGANGIETFPSAAVPANGVSLAEVVRSIWAGIEGTAAGENGITTWPSAAAPANAVSLAEAIRYIVETQIGTVTNSGGTATLGGVLGDVANVTVATSLAKLGTLTNTGGTATLGGILGDLRALALGTRLDSMEQSIQKAQTLGAGAATPLFTITGGPILVKRIVGIVTTILSGTSNGTLQATTTAPAATVGLSTTVAIDNDAAGTSYRFVGATGVLTPATAGAVIIDPVTVADCEFLVPIGNINFLTSGSLTGAIGWYMSYIPLSPLSRVAAA